MTGPPGIASLTFGPEARLPAGYARLAAGAALLRGHDPRRPPAFFGPPVGRRGSSRFDVIGPRIPAQPGVCYLAFGLEGVLLERVLRGLPVRLLSRTRLDAAHACAEATVAAELVLVDLWRALAVHQLELHDISEGPTAVPPRAGSAAPGAPVPPPYPKTQALAEDWLRMNATRTHPVSGGRADGILYGSRFGPAALCVALWDHAAPALAWGASQPLGTIAGLGAACATLNVGLRSSWGQSVRRDKPAWSRE